MSKSSYKFQQVRFSGGQLSGLLVKRVDGVPVGYQNLFITHNYFKTSHSYNTIKSMIKILGLLSDIFDFMNLDVESRFKVGSLLTISEIELLTSWLMRPVNKLYEAASINNSTNVVFLKRKKIELNKYKILIDEDLVEPETSYVRISLVAEYLHWLAGVFDIASSVVIEKMKTRILRHRPIKINRFDDDKPFKSLNKKDKVAMLQLVEPNSPNNPWKVEEVQHRNKLIVSILLYTGCRKGELLSLKVSDIESDNRVLKIRKRKNDIEDTRVSPALPKTRNRDIEVGFELHGLIEDYIIKYRSKVMGANKTPFLFVSHQKGATEAKPLSNSAVDRIFNDIKKVLGISAFPHALRHTWNDVFSEKVEQFLDSGELTKSEVEDIRSYAMGWKPDSGTAKIYTKRYEQKKAMKISLHLQKRAREGDKEIIDVLNTDVPF